MSASILIVDDEVKMARLVKQVLEKEGRLVQTCSSAKEAVATLRKERFDLVITDLKMPDGSGMEVLETVKEHHPQTSVIMMTAFGTTENAVEAMKKGALDYITKPFKMDELEIVVDRALEQGQLKEENIRLKSELSERYHYGNIVGLSDPMKRVLRMVEKVARTKSTVLILGESGTGKELVARAIHYESPRSQERFVRVNCAAIPQGLLESELFGHEKGAFTGAIRSREGKFELADKGTIFLDEIGDLPPETQVKLLRVLQEEEFERVGGNRTIKVDVRVIAATNRDLERAMEEGNFREDLFYRLNVVSIRLPRLSEKREDIPDLVNHFVDKFANVFGQKRPDVPDEIMRIFEEYPWPGNVRELENCIEHALVMGEENHLSLESLPLSLRKFAEGGMKKAGKGKKKE